MAFVSLVVTGFPLLQHVKVSEEASNHSSIPMQPRSGFTKLLRTFLLLVRIAFRFGSGEMLNMISGVVLSDFVALHNQQRTQIHAVSHELLHKDSRNSKCRSDKNSLSSCSATLGLIGGLLMMLMSRTGEKKREEVKKRLSDCKRPMEVQQATANNEALEGMQIERPKWKTRGET